MLEHTQSHFSKDYEFCYIVGSFAITAPNLRTPNSDIDVICSMEMNETEIRYLIKQKFPNLPHDIPIDIAYKQPENGIIERKICYWQNKNDYITLKYNKHIHLKMIHHPINLPSVCRNPNKTELFSYLDESKIIDMYNPYHCYKSIKNHYGLEEFNNVLNGSCLDTEVKNIIKDLLDGSKLSKLSNGKIKIDRHTHTVIDYQSDG